MTMHKCIEKYLRLSLRVITCKTPEGCVIVPRTAVQQDGESKYMMSSSSRWTTS